MKRCLRKTSVSLLSVILSLFLTSCSAKASDVQYVGFFPGEGIKLWSGSSWSDYATGLPADIIAEQIASDSKGTLYLTTEYSGIFSRSAADSQWKNIATQDLRRRTQLSDVHEFRRISAFCIDPSNESRLYLATKHTLYSSADKGTSWQKITITNNKNSYYFTSLAIVNGTLFAGTSFNGILRVSGDRVEEFTSGIPKEYYSGTLNFCEGVSSLASYGGTFYSGYLFGRGICESPDGRKWSPITINLKNPDTEGVYSIVPFKNGIIISTDEAVYEYSSHDKKVSLSPIDAEIRKSFSEKNPSLLFVKGSEKYPPFFVKRNVTKYTIEKENKAGNTHAMYVSWSMINKNFDGFLDIVVRTKMNTVIIDVKDDNGVINAPVESKTAREIGAIRNTNIKEIVKSLHGKGIHVVARNVTFKDKKLYEAYESKYAIWDKVSSAPWVGMPRERWCDPYSKFVRDYNIEIAKETAKLGFDEIQFDYIRFPTDGQTARCQFRYRENDDTYKSEIMGDFLQQARKEAGVPVSIDIYGYNAWYRFGNLIGQDIEFLSRFVDCICPMVYPSHFGSSFYKRYSPAEQPYRIVRDSALRSIYLSHNRTVIRLWIQDWKYLSPTWGPEYIKAQLRGIIDGGGNSFSFWNPSGDHSMVDKTLNGR
jgi:hypothetical protein